MYKSSQNSYFESRTENINIQEMFNILMPIRGTVIKVYMVDQPALQASGSFTKEFIKQRKINIDFTYGVNYYPSNNTVT